MAPPSNDKAARQRKLLERLGEPRRVLIDEGPLPATPADYRPLRQRGVSAQEERFLQHWATSYGNATQSAKAAGYPVINATKIAATLLAQSRIQNRLAEIEREMMEVAHINAESLFREIVTQNLRLARARVPVQVWNPPCRYCHGVNNEYQRTHAEFETDLEYHITHIPKPTRLNPHPRVLLFDPKGGPGYDVSLPPNPNCPNCHGHGDLANPVVRIKDTRYLTADERELFAGAKKTKDGVETLWRDQAQARNFLNDLALRMADSRRPEDAVDITDMSVAQLRQFLTFAKEQGYDVDLESLDSETSD